MSQDRVYVVQQSEMPVYDLGLELFRENVASAPGIKERLLDTLLELIHKERIGEAINRSLIKSVTQMLVDLGYATHCHHQSRAPATPWLTSPLLLSQRQQPLRVRGGL